MGNATDVCNPGHSQQVLSQNGKRLQTAILNSRKQLKQLPPVPTPIQDKILSLLKLNSMQQLYANSKIWKVKVPHKFCYVNQPSNRDSIPFGICSIFLYTQKNQFIGFFRGLVNNIGLRENKGCLYVYSNGDYFVGDKEKSDYGVYIDEVNEYKYEGDWINGKPHGVGTETTKKGKYLGYFLNGKKHGEGKYQFTDGSVFQGQFVNNQIEGHGTLINQKQQYQYVGEFRNGQKLGKGVEKTKIYIYDGQFNKNRKQGSGKLNMNDGKVYYEGHFQNDKPHGKGQLKHKNQSLEGVWYDGKINTVFSSPK